MTRYKSLLVIEFNLLLNICAKPISLLEFINYIVKIITFYKINKKLAMTPQWLITIERINNLHSVFLTFTITDLFKNKISIQIYLHIK